MTTNENTTPKRNDRRPEVEVAYENAHLRANDLIERLKDLLQDMPAPDGETRIHWGHVGNLGHINEQLSFLVTFLGGDEDE